MSSNLTKELQRLTALPTAELLRELDRCRERIVIRIEAAGAEADTAAGVVTSTPPAAPAPTASESAAVTPAPPAADVLLMDLSPETVKELAAGVQVVTAPAGALQQVLTQCAPGKSPGDVAVLVDKEPVTGQDLLDLIGTGDIGKTKPVSIAVDDLKRLMAV
jgi:hypothetical protein